MHLREHCRARAGRQRSSSISSVEPIKHGLTNESWLVRTASDAVVVRISNRHEDVAADRSQSEAIDPRRRRRGGHRAAGARCDPAHHVLVTRYLGPDVDDPTTPRRRTTSIDSRAAAAAARDCRRRRSARGRSAQDVSRAICARSMRTERAASLRRRRCSARRGADARSCSGSASARLCHNDVHHLNIVDNGELTTDRLGIRGPRRAVLRSRLRLRLSRLRPCSSASACWQLPGESRRLRSNVSTLCCWLFEYIRDLWTAVRAQRLHLKTGRAIVSDRAQLVHFRR